MKKRLVLALSLALALGIASAPATLRAQAVAPADDGVESVVQGDDHFDVDGETRENANLYNVVIIADNVTLRNCTITGVCAIEGANATLVNCTINCEFGCTGSGATVTGGSVSGNVGISQNGGNIRFTGVTVGGQIGIMDINGTSVPTITDCTIGTALTATATSNGVNLSKTTVNGGADLNGRAASTVAECRFKSAVGIPVAGTTFTDTTFDFNIAAGADNLTFTRCTFGGFLEFKAKGANSRVNTATIAGHLELSQPSIQVSNATVSDTIGIYADDVTVRNSSAGSKILLSGASRVTVEDCAAGDVIGIENVSNSGIESCSSPVQIKLTNTSGVSVKNCRLEGASDQVPLHAEGGDSLVLEDNVISGDGSTDVGISVTSVNFVSILGNTVSNITGGTGDGITTDLCTSVTVSGNSVTNVSNHAYYFFRVPSGTTYDVSNNRAISASDGFIIYFAENSTMNISGNTSDGCPENGMAITGTDLTSKAVLVGNQVKSSKNGIILHNVSGSMNGDKILNSIGNDREKFHLFLWASTMDMTNVTVAQDAPYTARCALTLAYGGSANMVGCIFKNYTGQVIYQEGGSLEGHDNKFYTSATSFSSNPLDLGGTHNTIPQNNVTLGNRTSTSASGSFNTAVEAGAVVNGALVPGTIGGNSVTATYPETDPANVGIYAKDAYGNIMAVGTPSMGETVADEEQVKAFVARLYDVFLDRVPEQEEIDGWAAYIVSGAKSAGEVAAGFIFSPEFINRNLCTPHFLEYLYRGLFNRAADEDGFNGWVLLINDGYSRERVVQGFLTSPEFFDLCETFGVNPGTGLANVPTYGTIQKAHCTIAGCTNEAPVVILVVGLYDTVFGRVPEQEEIDFWVDLMAEHRPDVTARVMVNSFLNGEEYTNLNRNNTEYVTDLYHAIFNREPDGSGLSDWVNRLDNEGWTREQVLNGFTSSQEFMDQCLRTGIEVGPEV